MKAAFKSKTGQVLVTGTLHDIDALPESFEVEKEGFVDEKGNFLAREELTKTTPAPDMPNLGVTTADVAGKHNVVNTRRQLDIAQRAIVNADVQSIGNVAPEVKKPLIRELRRDFKNSNSNSQGISPNFTDANAYTKGAALGNKGTNGVSEHEKYHLKFREIGQKFGEKARFKLARNIYNSIPPEARKALDHYTQTVFPSQTESNPHWHEEKLAGLFNYLNNESTRKNYHTKAGHAPMSPEYLAHNQKMKQAYRAIQIASKQANKRWLTHNIELFKKSEELSWELDPKDITLASNLLTSFDLNSPEFQIARFMAHGYYPDDKDLQDCLRFEGDFNSMALAAHNLPVNYENLATLDKLLEMDRKKLIKSDFEVAALPRVAKPFDEHSIDFVNVVNEAIKN